MVTTRIAEQVGATNEGTVRKIGVVVCDVEKQFISKVRVDSLVGRFKIYLLEEMVEVSNYLIYRGRTTVTSTDGIPYDPNQFINIILY